MATNAQSRRVKLIELAASVARVRPIPESRREDAELLGELLRRLAYSDLDAASDRVFDRLEDRIEALVRVVAPRVVPDNIASAIDTAVTIRTTSIDERISGIERRLDRLELTSQKKSFRGCRRKA